VCVWVDGWTGGWGGVGWGVCGAGKGEVVGWRFEVLVDSKARRAKWDR
jgi:hypothetical protein